MLLHKRYAAVTLFEVLLVLMVASMIAVGVFKYQALQRQKSVANTLAIKMYTFSQSVRAYVDDNEAAMVAGTWTPTIPPTCSVLSETGGVYTLTGVCWLTDPTVVHPGTQQPYLDEKFTFNTLPPLELMRNELIGDEAIETIITIANGTADIHIEYGMLYEPSKTAGEAPQPMTAITATAAKTASNMYDPQLGPSTFAYTGGIDENGELVPIQASLLIGGTNESYLRIDGTNQMEGDLNFSTELPHHHINNPASITFVNGNIFHGIGAYPNELIDARGGNVDKVLISVQSGFCTLTTVDVTPKDNHAKCVITDRNGYYYLNGHEAICGARCFTF